MWRALPLCLAACAFEHGWAPRHDGYERDAAIDAAPDAAIDAAPPNLHLRVEAWMDGRSNLILHGTSVHWHHIQFAAPGRELFVNKPTKLDAFDWYPTWPDVPDAENRDCNCDSSTYSELPVGVPRAASMATLTVIQARKLPTILQQPTAPNDYTLIVEVTDVGFSGSSSHIIDIDVVVN